MGKFVSCRVPFPPASSGAGGGCREGRANTVLATLPVLRHSSSSNSAVGPIAQISGAPPLILASISGELRSRFTGGMHVGRRCLITGALHVLLGTDCKERRPTSPRRAPPKLFVLSGKQRCEKQQAPKDELFSGYGDGITRMFFHSLPLLPPPGPERNETISSSCRRLVPPPVRSSHRLRLVFHGLCRGCNIKYTEQPLCPRSSSVLVEPEL